MHYSYIHCMGYTKLHYLTYGYITLLYIALHHTSYIQTCIAYKRTYIHYIPYMDYIAVPNIPLHYIAMHCIALHHITMHYIALHCMASDYSILHYIHTNIPYTDYTTLHCIT